MSDTLDFEGYYKALGIPPTASADEVKRAFRERARDLHPDRNRTRDTTAEFQKLSAAYEVLKDPKKRADYNAEGARRMRMGSGSSGGTTATGARSAETAAPGSGAGSTGYTAYTYSRPTRAQAELRMCARCGCLSAQPRVAYFLAVRGLITQVKTIRKGGIYCARCAMVEGLKNNLANWMVGWWALPYGPVKVVEATLINLVGGERPNAENAELLYRQAMGFHYAGHNKIALGIIQDALRLAPSIVMRDKLLELRKHLGGDGQVKKLRNQWRIIDDRIFLAQAIPLAVIILIVLQNLFSMVNLQLFSFDGFKRSFARIGEMVPFGRMLGVEDAPLAAMLVTADRLTIYDAPNTAAETSGFLRKGERIQAVMNGAVGGWAAVKLPDGGLGYVASSGLAPDTDP